MPSIFSQMIAGEVDTILLAEKEGFFAFLELNPLAPGHVVVTTGVEYNNLVTIPSETWRGLMGFAQKVAAAIQKAVECKRVGLAIISLQVQHVHVHLVPLQSADDLNFTRQKLSIPRQELEQLAGQIRLNLPG